MLEYFGSGSASQDKLVSRRVELSWFHLAASQQLPFLRHIKALKVLIGIFSEAFYVFEQDLKISLACVNHGIYF